MNFLKTKKNKILFPKLIKISAKTNFNKKLKSFGSQNVKKLENKNYNLKKNEYFQELINGKEFQFNLFQNSSIENNFCL